jgi:hypothetical protein
MISAMTLLTFHVLVSLIGIATGLVVLIALVAGRDLPGWAWAFLITTIVTSVSGFPLPAERLLPSHVFGIVSLIVLAVAVLARRQSYRGAWRWIWVVSAALALYLNVFVGVVQAFLKVHALHALAPNGNEPPFAVAQLAVLALFVGLTIVAARRFRPASRHPKRREGRPHGQARRENRLGDRG